MKKKIINFKNKLFEFFKYNRQFTAYVILSLMCCSLVKFVTVGNIEWQSFFFDLSLILVIGSFGFFYKPQKQFNYYFIVMLFYTTISVINTIYYKFYSSFASFSLLTTLKQVGEVGDAVFDKIELSQFIYILFPLTFIYINRRLKNKDYFNYVAKFEKGKKIFRYVLVTALSMIMLVSYTLSGTALSRLSKQWNREYIVTKFGIITYQLNDLGNTLKPAIVSWFGYDVALKNFNDYMELNQNKKSNNKYTDIYKDKNVIFIHMESINTFLIDLEVKGEVITPNINRLSKEGMFFSNFYPQIGVGTSSDTEFTLNTSLMPVLNGTAFVNYFDREYISVPKLLKDKGYYTFSTHANNASMWNRDKMHPSLGYDKFYAESNFEIDELIGLGLSDKSFFNQLKPILEEIEDQNEKYMGTIITLSHHTPFANNDLFEQIDLNLMPENYAGEKTKVYMEDYKLGEYIKSAHYADYALGEFMDYVRKSNYYDDTVFVFYGDHDPKLSLKEFNLYYNFNSETGEFYTEEDEEYTNYDYYANELNRKTPLIIWTKKKQFKTKIDYYMGMIDVMPTVGNMLGIYNKYAMGNDIFEIQNDNIIAFPNGNFLTNKVYYNNSKEEYKTLTIDEVLSEDYIKESKEYTDKIIEVSNGIIVHNLLKEDNKKR